ncbi:MAG: class IV adenylate cyclase [Phycisphaeraceae bacterium]
MPLEIEAKMKAVDLGALREQLRAIGAERLGESLETNTYFDTDDHTLKAHDRGLRVRISRSCETQEKVVYITHKGPRSHGGLKRRSEAEVVVASADEAAALLVELGYEPRLTFEKKRERWRIGETDVMIDTLPLLGDWIEIEGPSEAEVVAVRDQLGLEESPLVKASYVAMLQSYAGEQGLPTDMFRFEQVESANM